LKIPPPDLSVLEPAVAEQLKQAYDKLQLALSGGVKNRADLAAVYAELGRIYHAYEIMGSAEACYRNAWNLNQQDLPSLYLLGYLYQTQGRFKPAVGVFHLLLSRESRHLAPWLRLGDSYRSLNELEKADDAYAGAAKLNPEDPALLLRLGELALANKHYREAIDLLTAALEKQPAATRLHYSLAMAWRALGDPDRARHHLAQRGNIGIRPPDPFVEGLAELALGERVQLLRGKLAFSVGRYQEAAEAFAAAVEAEPTSARARINLGVTYNLLGRRQEAEYQLTEALKLDAGNVTAYFNLGVLAAHAGAYDRAAELLFEAVTRRPDDPEIHLELAAVQRKKGQGNSAFIHYAKAVKLDPNQPRGWLGQASMLAEHGRYREAVEKLEQASHRLPTDGQIAHALATLLAGAGDLSLRNGPRALDLAQRVFNVQASVDHAVTLAMAHAENNNCEAAAKFQRLALEKKREQGNPEMVKRLAVTLGHYEKQRPCRIPSNEEK